MDCDPDDQHMAVPRGENVVAADVAEPRCSRSAMLLFVPLGRASSETTSAAFTQCGGFTVELNATHDDPHESFESCPTVKQLPLNAVIPG